MIKAYRKYKNGLDCYEVTTVNVDSLEVERFHYRVVDGKLLKFSTYESDLFTMGYDGQIKPFERRMKELSKELFDINEVLSLPLYNADDYTEEQRQEFVKVYC